MRKLLWALVVLAVGGALFVAGKQKPVETERITIEVWFHSGKGEEREVLDAQVEDFNTMQTRIFVKAIRLPEGSYNEQVSAAALADDLPDLLDFDGPFVYNYAWAGYLIPLDPYVSDALKKDLLPSIRAQGTYGGKLYALGTFDSGLSIWGNKAYLKKAGVRIPKGTEDAWTLEEFNEALAKLQALDEVEYAVDFKMNYGQGEWYTYGFSPIIQSFGGDLINRSDYQSADGVLNGPQAIKAMEWFQSLFKKGYASILPAGDDDFYGSKKAALAWVGHWMWSPHHQGLGDDLILLPMPKLGKKAATGMGSWCWGITSQSKHPEAAWKFLTYLMQPDQILRMTNANGAVPSRISALEKSKLYGPGAPLEIFAKQLGDGIAVPRPITPAYPTITTAFAEAVQNIVTGADVKMELDKAVEKIDRDIRDNKGYPLSK